MPVSWTVEPREGGLLLIAYLGHSGEGSAGIPDGHRMHRAVREAVEAEPRPSGLILDLRAFDYRFGDWIGTLPLAALKRLGPGRVCLLADGPPAESLRALWEASRLSRIVPIFADEREAIGFLVETGASG
jgi:hypothetical protein